MMKLEYGGDKVNYGIGHTLLVCIPYSWKYWRSLNSGLAQKLSRRKYWQNSNLVVALHSITTNTAHVYQEVLPSSRLKYLNKAVSLNIYKKYNW